MSGRFFFFHFDMYLYNSAHFMIYVLWMDGWMDKKNHSQRIYTRKAEEKKILFTNHNHMVYAIYNMIFDCHKSIKNLAFYFGQKNEQ